MSDGVRAAPDVAGLSSLEGRKLCVLLWHYHDDDVAGPEARVHLVLSHLPLASGSAPLVHYRVDDTHSNAFTLWKQMGSPPAPSDLQYAQLKEAGRLATLSGPEFVAVEAGQASLDLALPRRAVSLLTLELP